MPFRGHTEYATLSGWTAVFLVWHIPPHHLSEAIRHLFPKTSLDPRVKGPLDTSMQLAYYSYHCLSRMALWLFVY